MAMGPVQLLVVGFDEPTSRARSCASSTACARATWCVWWTSSSCARTTRATSSTCSAPTSPPARPSSSAPPSGALIGIGAGGEEAAEAGAILGAIGIDEAGGHVLREEDFWYVDDAIPNGSAAAVALVEHRWAIGLRDAIRSAGGALVADEWVHPADLVAVGLLAAEEAAAH